MQPKVLGIIPARGGSKGLPGKNIRVLGSMPLIAHTIKAAKESNYLDRIIVTTDDLDIKEVCLQYGAEVPFLRPTELASDDTPTIDAILHCVRYMDSEFNYKPDYICILQCTTPLRTSEDIDGCITKCINSTFDACISVCEAESNPYWMKVFDKEKLNSLISQETTVLSRQALPKVYQLNGAVYVIRTEELLSQLNIHIDNTTGYTMPTIRSVDIDDELDFLLAETILKYKHEKEGGLY